MQFTASAVLLLSSLFSLSASAQDTQTSAYYTDPSTGIRLWTTTVPESLSKGGFKWGYALPTNGSANEYIGYVKTAGKGWAGISHSGDMLKSLLLVAWPNGDKVETSFRYATGYSQPALYTGNAAISHISHKVDENGFELLYRCLGCWTWDQNGASGGSIPSGNAVVGWAQASSPVITPDSVDTKVKAHEYQGEFGASVSKAQNPSYNKWAELAPAPAGYEAPPTPVSGGAAPTGTVGTVLVSTATGTAAPYWAKKVAKEYARFDVTKVAQKPKFEYETVRAEDGSIEIKVKEVNAEMDKVTMVEERKAPQPPKHQHATKPRPRTPDFMKTMEEERASVQKNKARRPAAIRKAREAPWSA